MGTMCAKEASEKDAEVEKIEDKVEKKEAEVEKEIDELEGKDLLKVTFKILQARGLRNADWTWIPGQGVSDAYCQCMVDEKEVTRTAVVMNSLEPVWDHEFTAIIPRGKDMNFVVWDKDPMKPDDLLGKCTLRCKDFQSDGYNGEAELSEAGAGIKAYLKFMVKVGNQDYPKGPSPIFDVEIPVTEDGLKKLGLEVDKEQLKHLFVCDVQEGPIQAYNEKVPPLQQLKKGQYIIEVNGIKGDSKKMEAALTDSKRLRLKVQRPKFFSVAIKKNGSVGISLKMAPTSLIVTKITLGGLVEGWNESNKDRQVEENVDRAVAVGGVGGNAQELLDLFKADGAKQILMCRPCPEDTLAEKIWHWSFF